MSDIQFAQVKPYLLKFFGWLDAFVEFLISLWPLYIQILLWVSVSNSRNNAQHFIVLTAIALMMGYIGFRSDSYYKIRIWPYKSYMDELRNLASGFTLVGCGIVAFILLCGTKESKATFYAMAWVPWVAAFVPLAACENMYSTARNNRDYPVIIGVFKFLGDIGLGNCAVMMAFLFWQINLHGIHYFTSENNAQILLSNKNSDFMYACATSLSIGLIYAVMNCFWYIYYIRRTNAAAEVLFGNSVHLTISRLLKKAPRRH